MLPQLKEIPGNTKALATWLVYIDRLDIAEVIEVCEAAWLGTEAICSHQSEFRKVAAL